MKIRKFLRFYILVLLLFLLAFLIVNIYITYKYDSRNCQRDYGFLECVTKYFSYWTNQILSKCYIEINESFIPAVNQINNINIEIYVINANLNLSNITKEFVYVNSIWNQYGINFTTQKINITLSKTYADFEDLGFSGEEILKILSRYYTFSENGTISVVFSNISNLEGGIHNHHGNYQLILISTKAETLSWTITHELGHALGLLDKAYYSGEFNLMNHEGCIRDLHPTNLNENQVQTVTNRSI